MNSLFSHLPSPPRGYTALLKMTFLVTPRGENIIFYICSFSNSTLNTCRKNDGGFLQILILYVHLINFTLTTSLLKSKISSPKHGNWLIACAVGFHSWPSFSNRWEKFSALNFCLSLPTNWWQLAIRHRLANYQPQTVLSALLKTAFL